MQQRVKYHKVVLIESYIYKNIQQELNLCTPDFGACQFLSRSILEGKCNRLRATSNPYIPLYSVKYLCA